MITILGLDPGLSFGWALGRADVTPAFGVWDLRRAGHDGAGVPFHRIRIELTKVQELWGPLDRVVYEVSRFEKSKLNAHMSGGWEATITSWCELNQAPYEDVPVATVKKQVANIPANLERKEAKRRMVLAMQRRGFAVTDEDAADALAVLEWARGAMRQRELWERAA